MRTVLVLTIMLLSFVQAGSLRKAQSEHFTLVFSEESEATAAYLFPVMEECYDELVGFFGEDPGLKLPVYIRKDENSFNAYFTSFPSNHIVIYNTHVPEDLMFGPDTLRLVFLHELTHAFTFSFRGFLGTVTSTVFGDGADLSNLLSFLYFLQEGIAVYTESKDGNGRLADPFMLASITEAVAEGIDVSYMDASGGRDIKPYGDLGYIYGGAFLRHAVAKYGEERIAEFFVRISKGVFSFPENTWSDMFTATLWDEWKAFISSVVPPENTVHPGVFRDRMRSVTALATDGSEVYYTSPSDSALIRLSDGRHLRTLPYGENLSSSEEYLMVSHSDGELSYTLLLDRDGRRISRFDGYHMGVHLSGTGLLLLVRSHDMSTWIDVTDQNGEVQLTIPIGSCELTALTSEGYAIMDGNICRLDASTGDVTVYPVPEGIMIRSLSASGDVLSFSYVRSDDIWTLPRYGEYENGIYRLYATFFLGGVWHPVRIGDEVYFASDFYDSAAVSRDKITAFGSVTEYKTEPEAFIPGKQENAALSYKNYVPVLSLMRGTILPLGLAGNGDEGLAGPGLTWVTMDASEDLVLLLSGGWDPTDRWFAAMNASYRKLGLYSAVSQKDGRTYFDISLSYSPTLYFSYLTSYLKLSETVKYSSRKGGFSNVLSLTYSDRVKKGAQRYHVAGYTAELTLNNLSPSLGGTVYIPSLFPPGRTDRPDYSMPATASMTYDPSAGKLRGGITVYLMTAEIQRPVRFLYLYLNSFSLIGSGEVTALMSGVESYRVSLEASFLLSPVLGTLSSMQWKLGGRLTYDGNMAFSLVFTPI